MDRALVLETGGFRLEHIARSGLASRRKVMLDQHDWHGMDSIQCLERHGTFSSFQKF